MVCPANALIYNSSECACKPGYILNATIRSCQLFEKWGSVELDSGVDYSSTITFPETLFSLDSLKSFTQSQAVFLETTILLVISWLAFCFAIRLLLPLGDGRSFGFKIRWFISRLDVCFSTRHWLEDQKVVKKRKTEMGGAFSMASWMLFIGLFAALLYQTISKRTVEVHSVRASNAPDLVTFLNDFEFNITTISSMTCSHLRGLGTVVNGNPGSIQYRIAPLSTFAKYSCVNTTKGPTITLRCNNCQPLRDIAYVSWQFIDLPNNPATAVGFQFNLTARNSAHQKHLSFVRGTLKNGSNEIEKPITFRGQVPNILKFNLFPRIFHNVHELKLIQPLFHEFLPGSYFSESNDLQVSLQSATDGLINTTLYINFLSDYIIEIDSQNILGAVKIKKVKVPLHSRMLCDHLAQKWKYNTVGLPCYLFRNINQYSSMTMSFLANLGGLFCFSIVIFFYLLVQCEYRVKKLRNEDSVMRTIRNRRKAQDQWDRLRKYVMYTWGPCSLDEEYTSVKNDTCCGVITKSSNRNGTLEEKQRQHSRRMDHIRFTKNANLPSQKAIGSVPSKVDAMEMEEKAVGSHFKMEMEEKAVGSHFKNVRHDQTGFKTNDLLLPPPPSLEHRDPNEIKASDLYNDLQKLHEYNVMLSEKLIKAHSLVAAILNKDSPSAK